MPGGARFVEGSTCETKFDVEARESNNTRQTWLFSRRGMQSGTLWVKQDRTPTGGIDVSDDLDFFLGCWCVGDWMEPWEERILGFSLVESRLE